MIMGSKQGALILVPSSEVTAGWWRGRGGRRKDAKVDIRPRDFGNVGTMGRSSDVSVAMRPVIKPVTSLLLVLVFLPSTSTRYCLQHPLQMREPPCSMNASSSSVILVDLTESKSTAKIRRFCHSLAAGNTHSIQVPVRLNHRPNIQPNAHRKGHRDGDTDADGFLTAKGYQLPDNAPAGFPPPTNCA
ncbi:hypothetical protein K438DRAFT_1751203 [Mycena galopus ATCC 62051]|nr:hypothetical protein K438DRAFT_1751203 [Mycena galopus ATCC 62051]